MMPIGSIVMSNGKWPINKNWRNGGESNWVKRADRLLIVGYQKVKTAGDSTKEHWCYRVRIISGGAKGNYMLFHPNNTTRVTQYGTDLFRGMCERIIQYGYVHEG